MKRGILFLIIISVSFIISCSSPNEPGIYAVDIQKTESQIQVTNNSSDTIYLSVFEQGVLAAINWKIHFDEPNITPSKTKSINYSEIYKGFERQLQHGDKVVVYYWYYSENSSPEVYHQIIEL